VTATVSSVSERPGLGIALRILSGLLFAAMVICIKVVSTEVPLGQVVFFRSFFALIPLIAFLWLRDEFPGGLRTQRPFGHLLRSGFGALAMFASFASIARLPVAEASLIGHLSPVFTAIAGALLLSERLTPWRIGGIALGLGGVFALVWPELGLGQGDTDARRLAGYGYGLLTAVLTAFALIMVRALNRTESPGAIAFWFVVVSMLGGVATLPWGWIAPDMWTLTLLVLAGLFGGAAHIAMTLAFRNAEASRLAPFEYVALIWPILADLVIFGLAIAPGFVLALPLVLGGAALAAMEGWPRRRRPA
jgi:drug/metabolite transporter (DMT)-like permease